MARVYLRVTKDGFVFADNFSESQVREMKLKEHQIIQADIKKLRSVKFNNLVHKLGQLCVQNIDSFHGMDVHKAVKRLQLESGSGCDEIGIQVPNVGMCIQKIPKSLSFSTMDQIEFESVAKSIARYIAEQYYEGLNEEDVMVMSQMISE